MRHHRLARYSLKTKPKKTREAKLWVTLDKERKSSLRELRPGHTSPRMVQLNPNFLVTCYIDTEDLCRMWPLRYKSESFKRSIGIIALANFVAIFKRLVVCRVANKKWRIEYFADQTKNSLVLLKSTFVCLFAFSCDLFSDPPLSTNLCTF